MVQTKISRVMTCHYKLAKGEGVPLLNGIVHYCLSRRFILLTMLFLCVYAIVWLCLLLLLKIIIGFSCTLSVYLLTYPCTNWLEYSDVNLKR